jgi:hypothetical protein
MSWRNGCEVIYDTCYNNDCVSFHSAEELQPYKEETMESKPNLLQRLKEYFDNTPRDVIEKEWEELSYLNEIGPTVDEYLASVKKYRQANLYPRTYKECAKILDCFSAFHIDGYKHELLEVFQELLICRAAYFKIAGEEMGLGKPWEPDWTSGYPVYCISVSVNTIGTGKWYTDNKILAFPTEEMRDAFYENFKDLIEQCKELL